MSKLIPVLRAVAAAGLLATATGARADDAGSACAAHADVVRKLADRFGEIRTSIGLHKDDAVVEVFSSAATGTWTIVVTGADGMSCLLAAGQRWEQFPTAAAGLRRDQGA
jgi:hypothetical protein